MLKLVVIIFGFSFLLSCSNHEAEEYVVENIERENSITLIDTITTELKKDTSTFLKEAQFHPIYIGKKADTIRLNYNPKLITQVTHSNQLYKSPDSLDLKIYVDTSLLCASVERYIDWKVADSLGTLSPIFYKLQYQSYPVFIENKSKDTLEIGYGEYIPLVIEALDRNSNWEPIQRTYVYMCGTGMPYYYLPSDEILITSCKLFDGDFKTKLRLVYGWETKIYSNEFYSFINESQFKRINSNY